MLNLGVGLGDLSGLHGVHDLHIAETGVTTMAGIDGTVVAVGLTVCHSGGTFVRSQIVRSSQRHMIVAVDLLIINIVAIVAVGLERESRATNVALEAALVEV